MAATSAAMLSVFATSSYNTTDLIIKGGNASLMLAASPLPVTRPMDAHMYWIADISGKASGMVHSMLNPNCAPA
jgi:hypothetical protein